MAQAKKSPEELKDEKEMKENYELMLRLGMVEMVYDLDLLGRRSGAAKKDEKAEKVAPEARSTKDGMKR